jgi:hypothetical protein
MPRTPFLLCILLLSACSDDNNTVVNDSGVTPTNDGGTVSDAPMAAGDTAAAGDVMTTGMPAPTFTQVYAIITNKCSPCHTTTTAGNIGITLGHLDMVTKANAYMNLVNAPTMGTECAGKGTRVTPGNEMTSIMYLKVSLDDPTPCGSKMPFGLPPLSQAETDTIEDWIKAGALNN